MSIALADVCKAFGGRVVLAGVTLDVRDGETLALIGYSGSGKSVLLKTIVGLLHPDRGSVTVDGQVVTELPRGEQPLQARLPGSVQAGFHFLFIPIFNFIPEGF